LTLTRSWRLAALALGLGALVLLSGCSRAPQVLTAQQAGALQADLVALQRTPEAEVDRQLRAWQKEASRLALVKDGDQAALARLRFLVAYAQERLSLYEDALASYQQALGPYGPLAAFRRGEILLLFTKDPKSAGGAYGQAAVVPPTAQGFAPAVGTGDQQRLVLASDPAARVVAVPLLEVARQRMDASSRGQTLYKSIDWLVRLLGANPRYSYALALLLLALVVKVVTTPMTVAAFRNIRSMQRLQPLIKELQAKHKGDQPTIAREQMRLFKKHKVSPLGGCLPMLIQMPILILVYQAIRLYIYQFSHASCLWIDSLAQPDFPLLVLYAASMYLSQKLTAMPSADPQQQQMQNTMAIMMPFMFTVLFATLPSAFILYWFVYNVLITAHQYLLMRQPLPSLEEEQEAPATGPAPARPQRIRPRRKK